MKHASGNRNGQTVFDELDRPADDDGKLHAEPDFAYLNRSGRAEMTDARALVEEWFARYPPDHQSQLRSRLRGDDIAFDSAFFELYLHELLLALGHIATVEPPAGTKGKAPDFLAESRGAASFYLEACVVSAKSKDEVAAERRANQVYDQLDKLVSPDFFIGVEVREHPKSPPPGQAIRRFLAQQIEDASWEQVNAAIDRRGLEAAPRWHFSDQSWTVDFFPIPKNADERGKPETRPVGLWFYDARTLSDVDDIRAAVVRKAGKYGDLRAPFVVAVNLLSGFSDENIVLKSLLGRTRYTIPRPDKGITGGWDRAPDGVWTSPRGPRYTRLSGVLVVHHARPWSVRTSKLWYCPNPWAATPFPEPSPRLPRLAIQDQTYVRVEGDSPDVLFGLAP
ncbi:MAG: hypothetical protein HS107_03960 [Thermoflexaceae bacterium]|nr:hypothetical protein [Thermoflexaceae bacterium]